MKALALNLTLLFLAYLPLAAGGQATPPAPDLENGRRLYAACAACHSPGAQPTAGPTLVGVVGRKAGAVPGFRYSRALKNARTTWDFSTLDPFLADPQAALPGNAMPFPGLPDSKERADVIAYLKTLK
ncbi:MAG: c-type cytochrome [Opitutaceae bacterium]